MAHVLFLLVVGLLWPTSVRAQDPKPSGWVELAGRVAPDGEITPQVSVYALGPLKGKFGWTAWTMALPTWGEALGGVTFTPVSWIQVSGLAGIETYEKSPARALGTIWVGKGRWSILSLQENGGSGRWQRNVASYKLTPTLSAGAFQQSFLGAGPYVEKWIGKVSIYPIPIVPTAHRAVHDPA
jgi:hypothetical protein